MRLRQSGYAAREANLGAQRFTDNFMPAEQLQQRCVEA